MAERLSRVLLAAQMILLALPTLACALVYALVFAGFAVVGAATGASEWVRRDFPFDLGRAAEAAKVMALLVGFAILALGIGGAARSMLGCALAFIRGGRPALTSRRPRLLLRLLWLLPAVSLAAPYTFAFLISGETFAPAATFYLGGIALVPPILHLWLELARSAPARASVVD